MKITQERSQLQIRRKYKLYKYIIVFRQLINSNGLHTVALCTQLQQISVCQVRNQSLLVRSHGASSKRHSQCAAS